LNFNSNVSAVIEIFCSRSKPFVLLIEWFCKSVSRQQKYGVTAMFGMSIDTTIALCVATAFIVTLLVAAAMLPKHTRKRREFRRRGLS
jgi:hypothetical protein